MKVKILSYHAVAAWRWDMPEDDDCGICRVQFDGTCPKCKFPGDDCPISMSSARSYCRHHANFVSVMGQCTHSFHMHCLDTWINQESSQGRCPMCRQGTRTRAGLVDRPGIVVLIGAVFRIKGTVDQSEVQPEQTAQS
ncbi:hypothetical protein E4T50_06876 [Aureobasidium sp. EXF-12298]|nr:hypothetical protein E4T50_06876 [Aureobasidium sp. EXF-12298]KAI4758810.1 hypothetical protein E4T51_08166 [Aureobasidium sp. EXF-12344]KAI4776067.1 hypothetical protein E4T52_08989 [Aureobasidium sp. EXF-3400]